MTDELTSPANEMEPEISLETKLWRLSMIISAAGRIHSSLTLDRVLDTFLDIATGEVGAMGGGVFLLDANAEELSLKHSQWSGGTNRLAEERCSILASEAVKLGEMTEESDESGTETVVTLPLQDESKVGFGALQIYRTGAEALDSSDRLFLKELSHFASLSIKNARYHEDSLAKAQLEGALGVARDIQIRTLPKEMPRVPGYDVAGLSRPADETGGDSFDLITSESDGLTILLADAMGHGIGPALSVTQVRSMLRVAKRLEADLGPTLKNLNDQLFEDLASNRFVTAFLGNLDAVDHQLQYQSAGQGPLILYRSATQEFEMLGSTCPPLGILPMPAVLEPEVIDLEPGDTLALITDGVFEAENAQGEEFGEEPVKEMIQNASDIPCAEAAQLILARVDEYRGAGPQADDITIVFLRRQG